MTPRYQDVPEHWRHPLGPYRQAPTKHGGEWWFVNPFTGETPWLNQTPPPEEALPDGFEEIFGRRPKTSEFVEAANPSMAFRVATTIWEQELKYFKRAGYPEWAPAESWEEARRTFEFWEMGAPRHYEGRYGWMTRFPDSALREFDVATQTALNATHLVVAQYQVRLVQRGLEPSRRHPFVPPSLWKKGNEGEEQS